MKHTAFRLSSELRRHRAEQYSKWFAIVAITFVLTVFGWQFLIR